MEDFRPGSLDDWWDASAPTEGEVTSAVPPREPEPLPPPKPAPRRRGSDYSQFVEENTPSTDMLPRVYAESAAKNIYKRRQPQPEWNPGSIDDYDWGDPSPAVTGEPAYDPTDDWAITRGFKVASDQGTQSITAMGDMTRILGLKTTEEQVAEMLKIGRQTDDPSAPKLAIHGFTDVDSFGEGMSYVGEAFGQMLGSMWAAATTGGAAGAATGAAIGGGAGALAGGAGAIPGALAGGVGGFTKGTMASFLGMGVGGTFRELLQDKGVQEGLENGTVKVDQIYRWAMGGGAIIGALDAVPIANRWAEITGGKKLTKELIKEKVRQSVKKAALMGAVKGGLEEGVTEGLQGTISELGQAIVGGNVDLAERSISVIDQFLAGTIGAAPLGAWGGIRENSRLPDDPGRSTPAYPAGTSGPRAQPGGFAPGVGPGTGGPGTTGPGTGFSTKPAPPVDAEADPSDTRDYGKAAPGAPVQATPMGEADADIAAAMGFEEEEMPGRPKVVPTGKLRKKPAPAPVDPDISVALTPEPAAEAAGEAPAAPVEGAPAPLGQPDVPAAPPTPPRPPRGRRAPQVETIAEEAEQVIEPEGGIRPWREEFGPDPDEALLRMAPDDPRRPEVQTWSEAKAEWAKMQAERAQEAQQPVEVEPEPEVIEAEPVVEQTDEEAATQEIIDILTSMGISSKGSLSAALNSVGRRLGVKNLSKGSPTDILAFLRENGVSTRPQIQRESIPPEPEVIEEEEAPPPVEEEVLPAKQPSKGWQGSLKRYAEGLKPTKHKLEGAVVEGRWVGRYERQLALEGLSFDERTLKRGKKRQKLEAKQLPTTEIERYDVTARDDAKAKLESLVGKPAQYRYLWEHLDPDLKTAIGANWEPEARLAKPTAVPREPAKEREGEEKPIAAPPAPKRAPRAAIALPAAPETAAPKPTATTQKRTVRLTPTMLAAYQGTREQALKRLKGTLLRHKKSHKKAGTVTGVVFEGERPPAPEREKRPEFTVAGTSYDSTEAFDAALELQRKKAKKSSKAGELLAKMNIAAAGSEYGRLRRWERSAPEAPPAEKFPEGRLIVSVGGKTQQLTSDELFDKYVVETTTEEERLTPVILQRKPDASSRLSQHFRYGSKEPVQLSSVGFTEAQIDQLERGGFAQDGSMDAREFQRWRNARGGVLTPETTFKPRSFTGLREVKEAKPTYKPSAAVPETERVTTSTQKQAEAIEVAKRRAAAKAAAAEEEAAREGKIKEHFAGRTPTEKIEAAVKRRLMEPRESGKTKIVPVEPVMRPSEEMAEGRTRTTYREEKIPPRQVEVIPIPKSAVVSHEPTAAQLAKEAAAFVEAGKKPKSIAEAINAAFDRAMREAEKHIQDLQARAEKEAIIAATAIAEAKEGPQGTSYQAVRRGKFKPLATVEEESDVTTFRNAKAAYFVNGKNKADGTKPKPDDEMGAIWWEMGELKGKISDASKKTGGGPKANASKIELWNSQFDTLNKKRKALLGKQEAAEKRQAQYWDEQAAKLRVKYHEWLNKLVEEDKLTADQAFDIRQSFVSQEVMVKRKRRTRVTDPVIKRMLRQMPPPPNYTNKELLEVYRKTDSTKTPKQRYRSAITVFNNRVRTWAEDFIRAVDDGVAEANKKIRNPKARVELPHRANRDNNSAEENMVQFLRGRLRKLKNPEDQKWDDQYQLGQTVYDAWWAASLLHPAKNIRKRGISEHQHYLNQVQREEELYDQMFDATKTKQTVAGVREMGWVADLAEDGVQAIEAGDVSRQTMRTAQTIEEAIKSSTADTAIAEQLKKHFESPHTYKGLAAEGGAPTESMSGAEAIDRFTSVPAGSFRAYIRNALKRLVGDTPVHFISNADMVKLRGRAAGGFYNFDDHAIYINEAIRNDLDTLADVVIHEMAHAATLYAFEHNLRGTADIFRTVFNQVKAAIPATDEQIAHYLKKPEELIAGFADSSRFQKMLKATPVPIRHRAALRALARGRPLANMWDYIMAAVENAIGVFTPAGRRSYFDEIFSLFPDIAMSTAEQRAEEAVRGRRAPETADENAIFEHPFDIANVKPIYNRLVNGTRSFRGRRFFTKHIAPMEYLKRDITERFFGGDYNNPIARFIDVAILKHTRSVEDEMRAGIDIDNRLRRWASVEPMMRRDQLRDAILGVTEMSLDRVDARKTLAENKHIWDDAAHPLKSGKPRKEATSRHEAAAYPRAAYERHKAFWDALPDDLKSILSDRMDHMKDQMYRFDHDLIDFDLEMLENKENDPITLPSGMTRAEAADMIYKGAVTPELKAALGDNLKTLEGVAGRLAERGGVYWPVSRTGPFYISGRRNIALPEAEHGYVEVDKEALKEENGDRHFFVFTDIRDARDYLEEMGETGEEHVIGRHIRYINPITGERVTSDDGGRIDGKDWEPEPRYYVEVQHRFMAMGETVDELEALKAQMQADPDNDYKWISDPLMMEINHTPDKAMIPSQLAALHNNINSMKGKTDAEKATLKSMATNSFIRTQQGNRLTKKMLRRTGVAGYEANNLERLLATLNSNNEMMSRHIVNRRRMADIEKARTDARNFILAAGTRGGFGNAEALAKVEPHLRHLLTTEYGKDARAAQLSQDWVVVEERYREMLNPRQARFIPERWGNAVQSILVQTYLATPMYNVVNAMGYYLQSFTRIAGEIGFSAALRYNGKADAYMSGMGNKWAGFAEAIAEGKDFATGFLPRKGFKHSRGFREQRNLFQESMDKMQAAHPDDPYIKHLVAAAEEARLRNHVGQAGLDQINLNTDLMEPGGMQKVFRGIEQSQRVFRAVQEGIELDTRLKPIFVRLLYYLDSGMDPELAKQKAINEMANDQTGYAKENWPAWMNAPVIRRIVMFKKFPIQQTLNFYRAMRGMARGDTVAASQLFYMAAALSMVGGAAGLPPWELVRMLMYLFNLMGFPVPGNWTVAKSKGEKMMGDVIGERASEAVMYGLPRLAGIDLSSRLSLDGTLMFQQPKELTNDGIGAAMAAAILGTPYSTGMSLATSFRPLVEEGNVPKFISQAPAPRFIKDIAKAYDQHVNGPTTRSGLQTAEPPGMLSTFLAAFGVRTRDQARPFEQGSAAQQLIKKEATADKRKIVQRILRDGVTKDTMRQLRDYNAGQTDPTLRIKMRDITSARKRGSKLEREMQKQNLEAL